MEWDWNGIEQNRIGMGNRVGLGWEWDGIGMGMEQDRTEQNGIGMRNGAEWNRIGKRLNRMEWDWDGEWSRIRTRTEWDKQNGMGTEWDQNGNRMGLEWEQNRNGVGME